jgi:Flp pilus assembly protein TadG
MLGSACSRTTRAGESGQAVVESALTLPLVLFVILGTMQLFLMEQGRIVAQLAAYRAVRSASVNHGNCKRMTDSAILQLMPAIHPFMAPSHPGGTPGEKLAMAYARYANNNYGGNIVIGHGTATTATSTATGAIVWIVRNLAGRAAVPGAQDVDFDQQDMDAQRMEIQLIFWFPMKIPFANWVMARMIQAHWGLQSYNRQNPLMMTQTANWSTSIPGVTLATEITNEMTLRMATGEYVFPIIVYSGMRMMTPTKSANMAVKNCPPTPATL